MTNAWIGHSIEGAFIYSFGGAKESSAAAGDSLDMPDVSRYVFRVSLSIVLAFAFVGAARAGLKEGLEAVASKDYERAYRELLPLAEEGNPLAEAELGRLYGIGKGVPQNDALAAQWLQRAAQKGEASAQVNLAALFRDGVGVRRDYGEALSWYRRAADQGSVEGCLGIADMYVSGLGVGVDVGVAISWLQKAAALEYPVAQHVLGVYFWQGRGVGQDFDKAYDWFLRAANQRYVPSMVSLAMMNFGDGRSLDVVEGCKWLTLAQRLRPQNQEEARRVDAEWSTRCGALTRETREKVEEKVGAWVPKEIWYERKQARFRQILDEAAKEDLARQAAGR